MAKTSPAVASVAAPTNAMSDALLAFLAQHRDWEIEVDFYHDWQEFWQTSPVPLKFFVFSYPTLVALEARTFRKVWPHPKQDQVNFPWEEFYASLPQELANDLTPWQIAGRQGLWMAVPGNKNQSALFVFMFEQEPLPPKLWPALRDFMLSNVESLEKWKKMRKMLSLAYIDEVSGLYNQRKLFEDIGEIVKRSQTHHTEFAVFFLDIDYFKNVNDNYGHLAGTRILAQLGLSLKRGLRETDLAYRYGGDEFVIILTDTDLEYAQAVGERLLKEICQQEFLLDNGQTHISVSIGIATFPRDARDATEIIRLADRMMYEAKGRGRGQVCTAFEMLQAQNPEPSRY